MAAIRRLSERLIDQIAAGEVVERPASIVKELLENALDAGAKSIRAQLDEGGKARILIEDDGHGMSSEDARLAFDRHATSKIQSFEDLLEVATLGFRGEALASIASVARVELTTAAVTGEGTKVRVEGGKEALFEPVGRARGTTVEVSSLFYNVPARRKFLKSPAAEVRRISEVIQGYALAEHEVRFEVRHGSRKILDVASAGSGSAGLRRRVGQIFGPALADDLLPLDRRVGDGHVRGFVGGPSATKGRRYFSYVNGRLVRDKAILSNFYRAVRDTWKSDQFPALFLFLDLPASSVDVNVHPQKAEVRFRDSAVLSDIYRALREALELGLGEMPAPGSPWQGMGSLEEPRLAWQGLGGRSRARSVESPVVTAIDEVREASGQIDPANLANSGDLAHTVYAPIERPVIPLSGRSGEERPFRLLGQYKGTLVLLEGTDGLYIIDQHVAHERILYERLRSELGRDTPKSQPLLEPVLLDVSPAEGARLEELGDQLETLGFDMSFLHGGSVAVSAVPVVLKAKEAERLLQSLASSNGDSSPVAERVLDSLAASMACKRAVKMHEPLSADEMEAMVAELFASDNPFACPHGRPTILRMSDADLEHRFGRR